MLRLQPRIAARTVSSLPVPLVLVWSRSRISASIAARAAMHSYAAAAAPITCAEKAQACACRAAASTRSSLIPSNPSSPLTSSSPFSILSLSTSRSISTVPQLQHNSTALPNGKDVHVVFIDADGTRHSVTGKEGENLLALAHQNDVELEGACEASLACSTCHVILPDEFYKKLEQPVDEENDMLDLAFGLTDT
jgi:ferredoxin